MPKISSNTSETPKRPKQDDSDKVEAMSPESVEKLNVNFGDGTTPRVILCGRGMTLNDLAREGN